MCKRTATGAARPEYAVLLHRGFMMMINLEVGGLLEVAR